MNRRNFFKYGIAGLASLFAAPLLSRKGSAFADGKAPLSPTDPVAQSLGYNPDNTKVDVKKWTKKAGADGKTQKCGTCMFFSAVDGKSGNCQIFPNNSVMTNGWCNTWTKKA
jgi:hypothetical protein